MQMLEKTPSEDSRITDAAHTHTDEKTAGGLPSRLAKSAIMLDEAPTIQDNRRSIPD